MSAYNMLADQSTLATSAFTTADAVTTAPAFDPSFSGDFLGMTFQDEDPWALTAVSPSLSTWNPKMEPTFATANLERDLKNTQVRNGQPTPPLDDKGASQPGEYMATLSGNSWDDTPTPPSSDGRRKSSSDFTSLEFAGGSKRRKERVKREKFLERNRLAASKCRQKKKEHTMALEIRYKEQSDKREELNAEISRLRSEILGLKNEVLKHAQCGDEPIKLHLAQMVKQITYKDAQDPTELPDPVPDSASSPASVRGGMSFGFDDPLQLDGSASLEQQIRRDSEASMAFSADDDFEDLINVT